MSRVRLQRWPVRTAVVVCVGMLLVAVAVAPQLSARLAGQEYTFVVEPVDPIDPFRGAYVSLAYPDLTSPDLPPGEPGPDSGADPEDGVDARPATGNGRRTRYAVLEPDGDHYRATQWQWERPQQGPYLACVWRYSAPDCGLDSWFLPQRDAASVQQELTDGGLVAVVRIDRRGNAALVGLRPRSGS
ncbi:MAG: GDYXXLXY domain-containing protein [Actinomycetales bacterium]